MSGRLALLGVSELMMQSRLRESLAELGFEVLVAESPELISSGLGREPSILILDLQSIPDPPALIALARESSIPVLAYGQHTKANVLRQARQAGAGASVPRSQLVEQLPALLDAVIGGSPAPAP